MDEELEKMWKEAVVDYFKFLALQHFPGGCGKTTNISKIRYLFIYVLVFVFYICNTFAIPRMGKQKLLKAALLILGQHHSRTV
jgi:hypothetical protein